MEDMLPEIENQTKILDELLREHQGQDVATLDLREFQTWTDFFILATVTSKTHMDGLERHVKEYCRERGINVYGSPRKNQDEEWRLFELSSPDFGSIVVHLMNKRVREFYELERLWAPGHKEN